MIYGHLKPISVGDRGIIIKNYSDGGRVRIHPGDSVTCLIDPFQDESDGTTVYIDKMDFEEFLSNIDQDDWEFTDDLMYICGLGVDRRRVSY